MKEKIMEFFQSEKIRKFNKKVFNKKTVTLAIAAVALVIVLRAAFSFIFEVEGTVNKIDGSKITVSNFLTTQTVNVGDYPIIGIQAGDRIEISKNLSGQVYSIRDNNRGHMSRGMDQRFRGNGEERVLRKGHR